MGRTLRGIGSLATDVAAARSTNARVGIQYEEIVEAEEGEDLDEIGELEVGADGQPHATS